MPDIASENVDPSAQFVKARRENSNLVSYIVGKSLIENILQLVALMRFRIWSSVV